MAEVMQSLHRALDILEELVKYPKGRAVREISESLDLNKSTVHRILQVLTIRGYVEQDERSKDYRIGIKALEISGGYLQGSEIKNQAHDCLERLCQDTGCIVHLAILSDREVVYIDKVNGNNHWQLYSEIGKKAYIHSTGLGKAFLMTIPNDEVLYYIKKNGYIQRTSKTIMSEEALLKDLSCCRERGYAIDDEENEYGIRCVAVPVFNYKHEPIAAISAINKIDIMKETKMVEVAVLTQKCAKEISYRLGYQE